VLFRFGRFKGDTGRVSRTEDWTTSMYEVDIPRRKRPAKARRKQIEVVPDEKPGCLDSWMPW